MKKIIKQIFILGIAALSGYLLYIYNKPTLVIPFPYHFGRGLFKNVGDASGAHILLLGDSQTEELNNYTKTLQDLTSENLATPLKVFNWGKKGEGIHRTRAKVASLINIPPVMIYHGSIDDPSELRFNLKDYEAIKSNFKKYSDSELLTLITISPLFSKFIYDRHTHFTLSPTNETFTHELKYDDVAYEQMSELLYLFYEFELEELVKEVKSKNATIILTTVPLNFEAAPRKTCSNATTGALEELMGEIKEKIKNGDLKTAYNELKELTISVQGNADVHYTLATTAKKIGNFPEAHQEFLKSTAYDCEHWRSNGVYNAIIRKIAKKYEMPLVDFAHTMSLDVASESLFIDELHPQNLYYQNFMREMALEIKKRLNL